MITIKTRLIVRPCYLCSRFKHSVKSKWPACLINTAWNWKCEFPLRRTDPCSLMQEEKRSYWGDWLEDTGDEAKSGKREKGSRMSRRITGTRIKSTFALLNVNVKCCWRLESRIFFLSCHLREKQEANQDQTVYKRTTAPQCFAGLMGWFSIKPPVVH